MSNVNIVYVLIERVQDENGKCCIHGECVYSGVKFIFNAYEIKHVKYEYVVIVSIISPETQRILQSKKKRKQYEKKGKLSGADREKINQGYALEKLNAEKSTYSTKRDVASDRALKNTVNPVVVKLYAEYADELIDVLKQGGTATYSAALLFNLFQNDFFARRNKVSEKTLSENKRLLENICINCRNQPVTTINNTTIKQALKAISVRDRTKTLNLAKSFFDYCGEMGMYPGRNPFECYTESLKAPKEAPKGRSYSTRLAHDVEAKLHRLIEDDLDNDLSLAIPLVKGFRLPIEKLINIKWKHISIDETGVRIADYRDKFLGGTHNYIRPPLKETADFIIKRYQVLQERFGVSKLKAMNVVPIDGSNKNKKATLSRYFRSMLIAAGVPESDLKAASNNRAGGAGYVLLCTHYDHVLQERCGVDPKNGVGCYMRGVPIFDTTSDYYRALSDTTGNYFLQVIAGRDDSFSSYNRADFKLITKRNGATREIIAPPAPPGTRTAVNTKKRLYLPKGSCLIIKGPLQGTVRCRKTADTVAADSRVMLY